MAFQSYGFSDGILVLACCCCAIFTTDEVYSQPNADRDKHHT